MNARNLLYFRKFIKKPAWLPYICAILPQILLPMGKIYVAFRIPAWLKSTLFAAFLLLIASGSMAQVRTVKGTISAADTKETLPGASVQIKGSTTGVVSDLDGHYTIKVPQPDAILVFTYLGYQTLEIPVGQKTELNAELQVKRTALEEVVVIAYGTVKKSDLSGAVGSIKTDDLTKITALNPVQSLQGQVSGVQVTNISGTPGENPMVRIRGTGTIWGASPIYVVDGVILDDISFINSKDIQSMEILKDASATAMYGSRGANGVILVTTKGGNVDAGKTVFHFSAESGIQRLSKKIDLLNGHDFAVYANEAYANEGKPAMYNNVDKVPNTDWQDLIFRSAPIYDVQLSASGASKSSQYFISGSYFKQDGIIDKSSYERITLKFNNTYSLSHYVKFGSNLNMAPFNQQLAPDVVYMAYRALPTLEPRYADGSYASVEGIGNPLAALEYSNNFRKGVRGVGNIFLDVDFLKSFTFKTSYGIDAEYVKGKNFTPAFAVYNPDGSIAQQNNPRSSLSKSWEDKFGWLWENTLTFDKTFGKHSVNALAGYTMQDVRSEYMNAAGQNIIRNSDDFWYIWPSYIYDPTNNVNTLSSFSNNVNDYFSMISYLFRVNYTFNQRYILTATFRSDGSSKFAKGKQWGHFPSFALGWNISREPFMKSLKAISRLKLRASWGKIGNDKIPYTGRFSTVEYLYSVFGSTPTVVSAASYGVNGNKDLKWETTTQWDIGLEAGVFNDRLTGELDYYHRMTDDILIYLATPSHLGNGGALVPFNAGSVLNSGFEWNLGWRDHIGKVKYNVALIGSTLHNETRRIGGISGSDTQLLGGALGNGQKGTQTIVGIPLGSFYGYETDGIFQTQAELNAYPHMKDAGVGDLRFVDKNGDGIINDKDRTNIGSPIPKFILGLNLGLEVYGIDFSANIQGQWGNKILNAKNIVRPDPYNFETRVNDRWTGPGTSTTEPRASFGGYNYQISDYFIQDGSFVRIRNVTIGYTLPSRWSQKISIQKLRIYVKADNLYTFTKYTGYSPEIGSNDVMSNGVDQGIYPTTSVYSVGIDLNF
ncbi:MAG TPA: TonB-dependent receptor [Candidatus Cloacimonadota bacterium]|nr:TonB-dependent receptor [Candidatus Cloacimonadota bacterium]